MYDFTTEPDGPVYLCASAADQSIPDPDPTANETTIFATHVNQLINPATGQGWVAGNANLADNSCGSVILDRGAPTVTPQASTTSPHTGDLVTFTSSASDGLSGIVEPYSWDFGDNTPVKQGASTTHTYTAPGTYHAVLTGQDAAGNPGTGSVDVVVTNATTQPPVNPGPPDGSPDDDGTVVKPPDADEIGGDGGTRTTTVGTLKVIAPKKQQLGKKKTPPILLALTVTQPGTFQAALTKGPKIVAEGTAVLAAAGTVGFKLNLPKKLEAGKYQLQLTYVPQGAATGTTGSVPIKFLKAKGHKRVTAEPGANSDGPINVDAGPPLAANYGG
jgi:PKD repeat protein